MQSGFTKKAEEALKNSATTAYAYGHSSIGSEHILIGLMQTDESVAQTVLLKNEVDLERFEEMVSQLMHPDNMAEYSEPESYTPRAAGYSQYGSQGSQKV